MNVLVIGAGKMVEAILVGLKNVEDLSNWTIFSPSGISAKNLASMVGAKFSSNLDEIDPHWVLIGCKPQHLGDLSLKLGNRFKDRPHMSLLAAIPEEDQRRILGVKKLVRVMPNLPVKYGEGVTLLSSESSKEELKLIEIIFSKLGNCLILNEKELEELTLLSGSGPALFYEFCSILACSFQSLTPDNREILVKKVFFGAAKAASMETQTLSQMTNAVTSKGGVTRAVLDEWERVKLSELIQKGIDAGKKRTVEIKASLQN